jgi:hypothetical protein
VRHLKRKEEQKNEKEQATEDIADRHSKVGYIEIEMLKVVMHLAASRRKHFTPLPLSGKKLIWKYVYEQAQKAV